jgi:hypothetical protein
MCGSTAVPTGRRDTRAPRGRSPAVARAYARRAQRTGARSAGPENTDAGRTPFALVVMALLAVALASTLWLSTAATADSYHLQSARKVARNLAERAESLSREVATLETAPELARRARELGMVPAGNPARLIVRPDGIVVLVGHPRRATAPAPPPAPPTAPAPPAAPAPPVALAPPPGPPAAPAPPPVAAPEPVARPAPSAPPRAPAPGGRT